MPPTPEGWEPIRPLAADLEVERRWLAGVVFGMGLPTRVGAQNSTLVRTVDVPAIKAKVRTTVATRG